MKHAFSKGWANVPLLDRIRCKLFHGQEYGESSPGCPLSFCRECGIVYNDGGYILDDETYYLYKIYDAILKWMMNDLGRGNLAQALENLHFKASDSCGYSMREYIGRKYGRKFQNNRRFKFIMDCPPYKIPFSYNDNEYASKGVK